MTESDQLLATATANVRLQNPRAAPTTPASASSKPASPTKSVVCMKAHCRPPSRHWTTLLLASLTLVTYTQLVCRSRTGGARKQGAQMQRQLTPLEEQLAGCRTFKAQPIPTVDVNASMAVLDSYTEEQREVAQRFTATLAACKDFACLRQANQQPRAPGQFRFPHFFLLGAPKCATSSLYCHLIQHPNMQYANQKESHMLVSQCGRNLSSCTPDAQQQFLDMLNLQEAAQVNFTKGALDGSTHYAAQGDWLAEQLVSAMPWVKVAISLRDPISQALAMILHNLSHNRSASCLETTGRIYGCVVDSLEDNRRARYGPRLEQWMRHFPRDQLHVVQYEALINRNTMGAALVGLKTFLEVDPQLPSDTLPLVNWKHRRGDENALGRYWNMTRAEYEHTIELAKRNALEVIQLLGKNGHADQVGKIAWMRRWDAVWRNNLDNNCEPGPEGSCKVVVS